jgi:release factor glutamine methyltransferase
MQPTLFSRSKIRALIAEGEYALAEGPHPERARFDAEALLLHLFKRNRPERNRAWLVAHWNSPSMPKVGAEMRALVERRCAGEPIQYITGEMEFYGLPFRVTPDVLIPRPETEHLVEKALELAARFRPGSKSAAEELASAKGTGFSPYINATGSARALAPEGSLSGSSPATPASCTGLNAIRAVDVGTGSGCIAIALAHHLPQAQITAIDLSVAALAVAEENAERNGVAIRFLQGDLLAPVSGQRFEIVASNPPYVPLADRATLAVEVRDYEPALALFAGDDGLDIFRRLIPQAFAALLPGGFLLLEIGCGQSAAVAALLATAGFHRIEFLPDLQSIPRVACAQRP